MRENNKLDSIEEFSISETSKYNGLRRTVSVLYPKRAKPTPCENLKAMNAHVKEVIVEKSEEEFLMPLSTAISFC